MEDLSKIDELYYAPIRLRACDAQDKFELMDIFGITRLPFAPLPHNEGLTKSQRKNLKRRIAKRELKTAIGGSEKSVEHKPPLPKPEHMGLTKNQRRNARRKKQKKLA